MLRVAVALFLAAGAVAQSPPSAGPPDFDPLQTSAAGAYLASVGATVVLVGAGLALDSVLPDVPPDADGRTELLYEAGSVLAIGGVLLGPSVGNLTLGAGADVGRAFWLKGGGVAVGGGVALVGIGVGLSCVATGPGCPQGDVALALLYGGAGIAALGVAAGTVYDLATIPRNASRARAHRAAPPVGHRAVTVRPSGVGLAVSVGL